MYILSVGLNHKTAPIEVREKFSFSETEEEKAHQTLQQEKSILENVILSTCNRTEITAVVDQIHTGKYYLKRFLADWFNIGLEEASSYLFFHEEEAAVKHLYEVACGLDSLVLGETQILGQVKHAFAVAQEAGTTGTILNQLFREAVHFAKNMHHQTKINENAVSVSYAAVEIAKNIYTELNDKTVLLIGAGKMSELAMQNLAGSGVRELVLINRTTEKAELLANQFTARVGRFEDMHMELLHADIVLVSTSAENYLLCEADIEPICSKRNSPLLIIDIALPRNVDPKINQLQGVYLYDLDDLEGVISANTEERRQIVEETKRAIAAEADLFFEWERQLGVVPLIRELREQALTIQETTMQSLENKLPGLTEREYTMIGKHMKSIINQMLKQPILEVKEMTGKPNSHDQIETFKAIFDLSGNHQLKQQEHKKELNEVKK
ncbi:glutamyl-tRNA reductase [Listeria floridensis FSL S10-1187]|uniref:Glutamyl-tRNA reductase n=1 Tax=Listeria floridensis FSL S10-1187 TaxID=1265817 RepID=A0ABP3B1Q7_9LIST|nr:glutamyl-tRNA reductase [Listeria floridensis]EUJ33254.1 glutamyl-tRNA reductase [Listeria floridensis FSL S10-1187]